MRRQTQWALGGVLAGTVLLGAGTTLATFTDQAQTAATAGAASLALQVTPARPTGQVQVHAQQGGTELLVTAGGELTGLLRLSLPGRTCTDLPEVVLTVTGLDGAASTRTLCQLATAPVALGSLAPSPTGSPITLQVARDPAATTRSRAAVSEWVDLRFDLVQTASAAGLSDARTVRVHFEVPGGPADAPPPAEPGTGTQPGSTGQQPGTPPGQSGSNGSNGSNGQGGGRGR